MESNNNMMQYYPDPHFQQTYHLDFSIDHHHNHDYHDDDDDDDDESFIELAVDSYNVNNNINEEKDEEMELRVSFSSSFLQLPAHVDSSTNSLSSTTSSPMFSFGSSVAVIEKMQFPVADCVVNTLRIPLDVDHGVEDRLVCNNNHLEFLRPTRGSIGMNNGMMMRMLIKLRDMKFIKTVIASLIKVSHSHGDFKENTKSQQSLINFNFNFNFPQKAKKKQQADGEKSSRRILEINLDTIKGVFSRKTRINSSQGHHVQAAAYKTSCAPDNSIQSAIAHCKRSFTPNT